jgi:hypothetical protein
MKKIFSGFCILCFTQVIGWGTTGHRTIGLIAESHLTSKAKKKITQLLDGSSIAYASNWMDDIRSDPAYNHTHDWHWVTIPDGKTYAEAEKNPNGDIIQTLTRLIAELKSHSLDTQTESAHVKMLIHLVGDIHQPLHVGNENDQGGNEVKVKWFGQNTNLHSVWDSRIIDSKKFSYSELAKELDKVTPTEISRLQSATVLDWAMESAELRPLIYDLPENGSLGYEYMYRKWYIVERRLVEAGVRLAGVLNEIYE